MHDIIIGGDFNVTLNNTLDKLYGEPHNDQLAQKRLFSFMQLHKLVDIHQVLKPFKMRYTRYQFNTAIAKHLDYFLVSKKFLC